MTRMIIDGIAFFPVTEDPEKLASLHAKDEAGADSRELAEFAVGLGLTPPHRRENGALPLIVKVWPRDRPDGVLVWDLHYMEEGDPDEGRRWPPN